MSKDYVGSKIYTYSERRCISCKYHHQRMFISGRNPIYHHYCEHPDIESPSIIKTGRNFENMFGDRFIGEDAITPKLGVPIIRKFTLVK